MSAEQEKKETPVPGTAATDGRRNLGAYSSQHGSRDNVVQELFYESTHMSYGAELYGVTTKRLSERVKRNKDRFPADFMFQLTAEEKAKVVANCDHLRLMAPPEPKKKRPIGFAPWKDEQ